MKRFCAFIIASSLLLVAWSHAPNGYVNDYENILTQPQKTKLEEFCKKLKKSHQIELAIVTTGSDDAKDITHLAQEIYDQWKIGDKKHDRGILFVLSMKHRTFRIHTGYGAEGALPDLTLGRHARKVIVPHLKANDPFKAAYSLAMFVENRIEQGPKSNLNSYSEIIDDETVQVLTFLAFVIVLIVIDFLVRLVLFLLGYQVRLSSLYYLSKINSGSSGPGGFGGFGGGGRGGGFGGFGGGRSGGGGFSGRF